MNPSFEAFNLHPAVLQALVSMGVGAPTRVQSAAIPLVMDGQDALVLAENSPGKTLSYVLPLLSLLDPGTAPQALVLVPSKAVAEHVVAEFAPFAAEVSLNVVSAEAGTAKAAATAVAAGCDIVVGTPARLKTLIGNGSLDASGVRLLVLDEADGLLAKKPEAAEALLAAASERREQIVFFTGELTPAVERIVRAFTPDAAIVRAIAPAVGPTHHFHCRVPREQLFDGLVALIEAERPTRGLVVTRNKWDAKRLAERLNKREVKAGYLNGLLSRGARTAMLERFDAGEHPILVVTEQALREVSLEGLTHVVLHSLPTDAADYEALALPGARVISLVAPDMEADFAAVAGAFAPKPLAVTLAPRVERAPAAAHRPAPEAPVHSTREPRRPARPARRTPEAKSAEAPRVAEAVSAPVAPAPRPVTTGPLAPLPRHQTTWTKFRLNLAPGHRQSRDSLHGWLAQRTGVPRSSIRSIVIEKDHATMEVEGRSADRFMAVFGSDSRS